MTTVLCATNHEFYEDQPLNFDAASVFLKTCHAKEFLESKCCFLFQSITHLYSRYPRLYRVMMPWRSLCSGSSQVTSKLVEARPVMRTFRGGPPGFSPSVTNWKFISKVRMNHFFPWEFRLISSIHTRLVFCCRLPSLLIHTKHRIHIGYKTKGG